MVKSKVMYLGPLAALSHTGPSGMTRNFFRNQWTDDDYTEADLRHYAKSGGFKVAKTVIKKTKIVPQVHEEFEEIIIQ